MRGYASNTGARELVEEHLGLKADLKATGGRLTVVQAAEEFGGHYELRLLTVSDRLGYELMGVLVDHGVDVERVAEGEWALVSDR